MNWHSREVYHPRQCSQRFFRCRNRSCRSPRTRAVTRNSVVSMISSVFVWSSIEADGLHFLRRSANRATPLAGCWRSCKVRAVGQGCATTRRIVGNVSSAREKATWHTDTLRSPTLSLSWAGAAGGILPPPSVSGDTTTARSSFDLLRALRARRKATTLDLRLRLAGCHGQWINVGTPKLIGSPAVACPPCFGILHAVWHIRTVSLNLIWLVTRWTLVAIYRLVATSNIGAQRRTLRRLYSLIEIASPRSSASKVDTSSSTGIIPPPGLNTPTTATVPLAWISTHYQRPKRQTSGLANNGLYEVCPLLTFLLVGAGENWTYLPSPLCL